MTDSSVFFSAHTRSPEMFQEIGCTWVILGHSERRTLFHEDDEVREKKDRSRISSLVQLLKKKIDYILNKTSLNVIACIGETLEERESGQTNAILQKQLQAYQGRWRRIIQDPLNKCVEKVAKDQYGRLVIAYEPVWAIGTGRVATPEQAEEVHQHLRKCIEKSTNATTAQKIRIIYGGENSIESIESFQ